MVWRSFRVDLRVGLLVGVAFALVKTVQARRSTPSAPPGLKENTGHYAERYTVKN